jgi:hypothetical protein
MAQGAHRAFPLRFGSFFRAGPPWRDRAPLRDLPRSHPRPPLCRRTRHPVDSQRLVEALGRSLYPEPLPSGPLDRHRCAALRLVRMGISAARCTARVVRIWSVPCQGRLPFSYRLRSRRSLRMSIPLLDIRVSVACVPSGSRAPRSTSDCTLCPPLLLRSDADESGVVAAAWPDAARHLVCSSPARLVWRAVRSGGWLGPPSGRVGSPSARPKGAIAHAPAADITEADRAAGRSRPGRDELAPPLPPSSARPARRHLARDLT